MAQRSRPSPYRPVSPQGNGWGSSSSSHAAPGPVSHAEDQRPTHLPQMRHHQYEERAEHQQGHYYRPAPNLPPLNAASQPPGGSHYAASSYSSNGWGAHEDHHAASQPLHHPDYAAPYNASHSAPPWSFASGASQTAGESQSHLGWNPRYLEETEAHGNSPQFGAAPRAPPPHASYDTWSQAQTTTPYAIAPTASSDPHPYFPASAPSPQVANGVAVPRPHSGDPAFSPNSNYGEVLASRYQAYSPDPYTPNNHSRTSTSEAPLTSLAPRPTRSTAMQSASLFSNPGQKYFPTNTRLHPSAEAPSPYVPDFPSFSSSHTFTYPDTYPSRSHSGSSASAGAGSPLSPTSQFTSVTSQPQHAHATVVAANNRIRLANLTASQAVAEGDASTAPRKAPAKKVAPTTRQAIELNFDCRFCGTPLAKLTLRGGGTSTSGRHEGTFYCPKCVPLPVRQTIPPVPLRPEDEEASYADTLSAAVDRLEGISVDDADPRPPPATRGSGSSAGSGFSIGKKRAKAEEDELQCDVCHRIVATGGLRLIGGAEGEKFECTVEVICTHCQTRYLRCSDCGGGGGTRGVGRWRAKEMFPEGRRTCQLSHVRMGALNDMTYDVWPITSIPQNQTPALIKLCRELYFQTLLGTLAVPDMMESRGSIARSYEEVMKQATDSWTVFEPLITEDVEHIRSTRRYIALRWSTPATRKTKYKSKKGDQGDLPEQSRASPAQKPASPPNMNHPPKLIRDGKVLAGYILGECDLLLGSLHVALTLPTGSGESYDAASRLMQSMFRHVQNDIASINFARKQSHMPPLPLLKQAWSLHMIKKDSRIMSRIETRRGFLPLEDYLSKYPDADRQDFAPHRPVFLPPELLRGWFVYVKRVGEGENDEWLSSGHRKNATSSATKLEM